jgi:DNA invertase Pin-like site-specific DNA recombinase
MILQSKRLPSKAILYSRCSTNEAKQDVEVQLKELRQYCKAYCWDYDEISEYGSGYKDDKQPKLVEALEKIKNKQYSVILVYSMDRFSRQSPSKINALLDTIVENYKCRFIALQQGIDSDNELTWHVIKPLFTYFANKFSRDLGEKVKKGIERKKEIGKYRGGRPRKAVNMALIKDLRASGMTFREVTTVINSNPQTRSKVSFATIYRAFQKPSNKIVQNT